MTKKLLTFLTLLTLFFGVGWAETYSYNLGAGKPATWTTSTNSANVTTTDGFSFELVLNGSGTINNALQTSQIRIYQNATFTIIPPDGELITKVTFYHAESGNHGGLKVGDVILNDNTSIGNNGGQEWTCSGESSLTITAAAQCRVNKIDITTTSGGAQPTTYNVNLNQSTGGTISASSTTAAAGTTVTLTATPDAGYEFTSWEVLDGDANEVTVTNNQFTMPASDVEVEATFTEAATSATEWVLTSPSALTTGDVVLIVDKFSARAMSNNNGTGAAPSATSVTLNIDKSKVIANVTDALKWNVTNNNGTFQFTVPSSGNYLYATNTNNGVRVGNQQSALTNNDFTINNNFLFNTATSRYLGVYNNQDWRCYTSSSTNISETEVAFYKKVETGSHSVTVGTITGEGNITPSSTSANTGDVITVTAEPASGYELTALAYNGTAIDITSTPYTFTMPDADVTLTATFSLKNYVVDYQVTPSTAAANSGNRVGLINGAPYDDQTHASHSQMGTSVTFKLYTGNGWQIDDANVSVAYTDANGNPATLTPTKGDTNNDDGGYGTYFTFNMPASDVMINAAYLPYQPDLYILGNVNDGTHWNDGGLKMTYDPSANTYSIRIYASEENGYFRFYANGGNNGNPSYGAGGVNLNPLEGTQPKDLWKDGDANFCVPAGIYDIVVGQIFDDPTTNSNPNWWGQTTVTVTKIEPNFTFTPAAGEVYQGTTVTATSDLYTLLHAINSSVSESNVTNEVSLDGTTFSSSVALDNTGSATVTGKATYGYIQPTATANYTVNEIDTSSQFELVTSTDDIGEDVEYVIMNKASGSGFAMSTTQNNNNRGQTESISITNNKIIPTDNTQIITLEAADNGWYLKVQSNPDKYLYTVSSSNHLKTGSTLNSTDQYYIAKISVNETSHVATIEYQTPTKKYLRRNSGSNIFSCYESGQQEVYLYKRGTVTPTVAIPTFSPEAGTYNEAQSVTISCATDGATILYSTDGTNYSNYTGAITVSETTTLYAKATKDGVTSQVATAEYTINIPVVGSGDFTLVENDNAIKAGREYIIISKNKDYAAGAYSSGRFAGSTSFTLTNDDKTASIQNDVKVFTLEDSETEGYYYLKDSEGNYYTPSQSSGDISQTKTNLSVTYGGGFVKITTSSNTRQIGFNDQNGQKKFGSFTNNSINDSQGGLHHIYLYYRDGGLQKPEFTPAPGMYDVDVDVTITCATDGATIYYTTDGSEPSATNGTEYTGEIVVSQTTTFKAIAVKDGETSQIVSATYTITPHTAIETVTLTYSEPFTSGIGKFVVQNESGFSPVWTLDGNYGIKGTSFSGGVNYAATSRFLSPIIDMTDANIPELTFSQQINSYFTDPSTQCTVWIRETTDGTSGTWVQLPITFSDPAAAGGWTNDVADIDLSAYAGKKVQISFLYTNPTEGSGAGTWEIQNFMVADNSEYRLVNNIAEFLALENGTKAKFKNPVTVLYDYAQYSSSSYHEYIWVKDNSGYMQFYLIPTLNSSTESNLDAKAAYYENGDIIPAGFVVVKNYYENGKYVQAYSADALNAGFEPATKKGLADPDHYEFSTLNTLTLSDADIAANCNRYISIEKIKIASKSGKDFTFANESGTVNACVGYNKYNGDGSLLKDGENSADVTVPAAGDTYYNVKGIIQIWQGGWEFMPVEFTEWKVNEVTLRELCQNGVENNQYTISNRLQCVYIQGNKLWVKDDNGQSIHKTTPASGDNNYEIGESSGNTQLNQSLYDQSNWLEVHLADGSANAQAFYRHIIKGGAITGTFTNKTNPTMENVVLTSTALENSDEIGGTVEYAPNYYCAANFYNGIEGGNQACTGSENHGNFFFMNPKPQEYVQIDWAQWDGTKMIIPTGEGANEHGFNGEFEVNMSMNSNPNFSPSTNTAYKFEAIVRMIESTGGNTLRANKSNDYIVYPLNLSDDVVTGINNVTSKAVAGVKYYNLAGMESDRPFEGVNIIVTTYTDGSRSSQKVLK